MFKYIQKTGQLFHQENGVWVLIGTGYSGRGDGLNNHSMEDTPNIGPIPCGLWSLSLPYTDPKLGPICFRLVAMTYKGKRYGFCLHADNAQHNHSASEGCTVFPPEVRQKLADLKAEYMIVEAE